MKLRSASRPVPLPPRRVLPSKEEMTTPPAGGILELDPADLEELVPTDTYSALLPAAIVTGFARRWRQLRRMLARLRWALGAGGARLLVWTRSLARRWWATGRSASTAFAGQKRARAWVRLLWPGWPTTWGRLLAMAAGAFFLGCGLVLPFALADRSSPRPVAVARAVPATPAPRTIAPSPVEQTEVVTPTRADVAREMAREAFENGQPLDGIGYFLIARRAERRPGEDDLLILCTIAALADRTTAPAAASLLRGLGPDARPLLLATAQSHPDRVVQARARALIGPPRQQAFLRWAR